jgi:hypothetical protein
VCARSRKSKRAHDDVVVVIKLKGILKGINFTFKLNFLSFYSIKKETTIILIKIVVILEGRNTMRSDTN